MLNLFMQYILDHNTINVLSSKTNMRMSCKAIILLGHPNCRETVDDCETHYVKCQRTCSAIAKYNLYDTTVDVNNNIIK